MPLVANKLRSLLVLLALAGACGDDEEPKVREDGGLDGSQPAADGSTANDAAVPDAKVPDATVDGGVIADTGVPDAAVVSKLERPNSPLPRPPTKLPDDLKPPR